MRASPWRILIGPLYHPQILGDYLQDPQIIPFALNQMDLKHLPSGYDMVSEQLKSGFHKALNYIPFETQLSDLLAQIKPEDQPDILLWWGLYAPLPLDLPTSPIPTALIVSDWHENLTVVKRYASGFDYIFCDQVLIEILKCPVSRAEPSP